MNRLIYAQDGQTMRHVPPARVPSATYAVEDLTRDIEDGDRVLASGAATVASWSEATTAAAGPTTASGTRIAVASTTGITIGDPAVIVAADGTSETFEVAAVSTDAYVEARTSLAGSYPSGSTIYGIEVTAPAPAALVDDEDILEQERPLRVVWTYSIGSTPIVAQELIEFVRQTHAATAMIGEAVRKLRRIYPDMLTRLPQGTSVDVLAEELATTVEADLRARGIDPHRMLLGQAGVELLVQRVAAHAGDLGYAPGGTEVFDGRWASMAHKAYKTRLEGLTIGEPGQQVLQTSHASDTTHENPTTRYGGITLRM